MRRFYAQHLDWSGCGSGFSCAKLLVPVDYSQPDGATMRVAVVRKPASGTREGALIINPGGPGASGIAYARGSASTFSAVTTHFDLVSFDPRGVGQSRPIRCVTSAQLDAFIHVDPTPDNAREHAALVDASRNFAADCFARNHDYLSHVGTIDAARDMDVLRAALGDAKLTYYGASYGTYLGAKYAQLFPHRIRAMVLDGALDPSQPTVAENRVQAVGFETDLRDFLAHCANSGSCSLGSTPAAAEKGLDDLSARIDQHPLAVGSRSLGPGEFFEGLALGLYSPTYWAPLEAALRQAQSGSGAYLLQFSDALTDRNADGSYDNLVESNLAINCIDRPSPRNVGAFDAAARSFAKASPHFGTAIAYGSLPCAFWHVPPVEQAHAVAAPGAPPIVVIGTTRDPATPYVWAQALAHQLSSGVLVTYNGDGHTAYARGNSCISTAVDRYLNDAVAPRDGLRCG
ncbi:MAG TPA: alpha/beta hydrolase [Mycobacteriales bacterium]|jgi:pimeloyl-ACP methyl ester carboxylesterase|nr:alpha/beta hydrolase [Mycobacteriales bacterium]